MLKNEFSDLLTDQEMAFARLILSATMTDRDAAQAAGLDPDTAADIKARPHVRAYILEHRAAVQQQSVDREQVLRRLWELANMGPEITRGSITGQVKAISIIVAIEGLIPARRAGSAQNQPAPPPNKYQIYSAAWLAEQKAKTTNLQPDPPPIQEKVQREDGAAIAQSGSNPGLSSDAPPHPGSTFDPSEPIWANRVSDRTTSWVPDASVCAAEPDTRVPFSIKKNPFTRRR
jgi:hypothetical protein